MEKRSQAPEIIRIAPKTSAGIRALDPREKVTILFMQALEELSNRNPPGCSPFAFMYFALMTHYAEYLQHDGNTKFLKPESLLRPDPLIDFLRRNKEKKPFLNLTPEETQLLERTSATMSQIKSAISPQGSHQDSQNPMFLIRNLPCISTPNTTNNGNPPADEQTKEPSTGTEIDRRNFVRSAGTGFVVAGLTAFASGIITNGAGKKAYFPGDTMRTVTAVGGIGAAVAGTVVAVTGGMMRNIAAYKIPQTKQEVELQAAMQEIRQGITPGINFRFRELKTELEKLNSKSKNFPT